MTPAQFEQSNMVDAPHFIKEANTEINDSFVDFEDIDVKKPNSLNTLRKLYTANIPTNEFGFKYHFKAAARGDKKMLRINAGKSSILDDKLYDAITGVMKFPKELGIVSTDFTKGIDSNIKYTLNNLLDIKFYSDETKSEYDNLRKEVYRKGANKGLQTKDIALGTISSENFTHFISYNEIGFAYKELDLAQEKFFICANITDRKNIKASANYKYMKKIDFSTMTQGDVEVSLHVDSKFNYVYLVFRNQGDIVYIVSQRKNLNTANCSFINNKKFTILENTKKSL